MKCFEYGGYEISHVGSHYTGQSRDGDNILFFSTDLRRLMAAIDQLWAALERGASPPWFTEAATYDLDHQSIARNFNVPPKTAAKATSARQF
jgi:hypothetical protein